MKKTVGADVEVKAPEQGNPEPVESRTESCRSYDVNPGETVSIIAGNRVLFLGKGLKEIRISK